MKLYYTPGTCSLSTHIALVEAGLPYTLEKVDLYTKNTETGADFKAVNPKGAVPTLQLDGGDTLTEGPVILQYISDLKPQAGLVPASGMARYRQQEWLNFITSDLHKGIGRLFAKDIPEDAKTILKGKLTSSFAFVDGQLQKTPFIAGDAFTAADGYLFTVLRWCAGLGIDLAPYGAIVAYMGKIAARPAVQAAMKAEGLI